MNIKDTINNEFDSFFHFEEGSDKKTVTSTSCKLFAQHIAKIAYQQATENTIKALEQHHKKVWHELQMKNNPHYRDMHYQQKQDTQP